jgi:hypothetical protein
LRSGTDEKAETYAAEETEIRKIDGMPDQRIRAERFKGRRGFDAVHKAGSEP